MSGIDKIVQRMKNAPNNISFSDLKKVCEQYFGKSSSTGSSHFIYKMPWKGDPRVNIQNSKGKAKVYQVKQVLIAIDKLNNIG